MPKKINSRAKGNSYELKIINKFKEYGWGKCCSSRSESKRKDDAGIDICYTDPFQVQCKAVERLGNYHDILSSMPKERGLFNVVFHKKNRKGSVVVMEEADFFEIVELLIKHKIIKF